MTYFKFIGNGDTPLHPDLSQYRDRGFIVYFFDSLSDKVHWKELSNAEVVIEISKKTPVLKFAGNNHWKEI